MIRVLADCGAIFIDGRPGPVPGGTLQATLAGTTITIANIHGGAPLVVADASVIADGNGNGFASPDAAMSYLGAVFAKQIQVAFSFVQADPLPTWVISHGLGFSPNVTVLDTTGEQVIGTIAYPDPNTTTIGFGSPVSGTAYLS